MRKLLSVCSLFILAALSSCDALSDATSIEVPFNVPVEKSFTISGDNAAVSLEESVKLTETNDDFKKYKDGINKMDLDVAEYSITDWNGPAGQTLEKGSLQAAPSSTGTKINLHSFTALDLATANSAGFQKLDLSEEAKTTLAGYLRNDPNTAHFFLSGTVNNVPVSFKLNLKFTFKAVYKGSAI